LLHTNVGVVTWVFEVKDESLNEASDQSY
jgi:hypothetical protein